MVSNHCVRVYNNGEWKEFTYNETDTAWWVAFNMQARFGCALFVNGECKSNGYLTDERCARISKMLKESTPLPRYIPM